MGQRLDWQIEADCLCYLTESLQAVDKRQRANVLAVHRTLPNTLRPKNTMAPTFHEAHYFGSSGQSLWLTSDWLHMWS